MFGGGDWRKRGRAAEHAAARALKAAGYEILARNVRTKSGELDIVAREAATLVVVEVKYRERLSDAYAAVGTAKRRRLGRAAREARVKLGLPPGVPVRFDVVVVVKDGRVSLRRGAFDAPHTFLA
jgi:putative endonuclease